MKRGLRIGCLLGLLAAAGFAGAQSASAPRPDEGGPASGNPAFGIEIDASYETRLRSAERLVEPYAIKSGIDLSRNFLDRKPLGRVLLEYGRPAGLSLALESSFRREWAGDYFKADNLPTSLPGNPFATENLFLTRGVVYWRSPELDIAFGRDSVDYGKGLKGGLLPSARLPFFDSLRLEGRLRDFSLQLMIATIPARRNWETFGKFHGGTDRPEFDVDPSAVLGADVAAAESAPYGFEDDENPTTVVEALHRAEWRMGAFNLGFTEQVMMARRNNRFYLTDFFPLVSWHQTGIYQTNNSMVLDLEWRPTPALRVLGQAGFDDINANLFGVGDTGAPTIDAYVLGLEWRQREAGQSWEGYAEAGYTHWLWGNYSGTSNRPFDENPLMRFQYRLALDSGGALLPLSSPYGPGALWFRASGGWELEALGLRLGAELLLLSKNREANLIDTVYAGDSAAATGERFLFAQFSLPLRYRFRELELSLTPSLLCRQGEFWAEADLAAGWRFRGGRAGRYNGDLKP